MRVLVTGICGFVGSILAEGFKQVSETIRICGVDNLMREGSEVNRLRLKKLGIGVIHGDLRASCDVETLPDADWVIDAAANPSVLAGVIEGSGSRTLLEHNLIGTLNMLEYCRSRRAGLILISTSRVYSASDLSKLPLENRDGMFHLREDQELPQCVSSQGVSETFPTSAPISLYGATKLCSEALSLEYAAAFGFPVWINRCGLMSGAGQFGRPDQGIIAFWINSVLRGRPLKYTGFGGEGLQVRDCLHPIDLIPLILNQVNAGDRKQCPRIVNVSGGERSAFSLAQMTAWCSERFGRSPQVEPDLRERPYDIPWLVLDSTLAATWWQWSPKQDRFAIFEDVASHAEHHPEWLEISGVSQPETGSPRTGVKTKL